MNNLLKNLNEEQLAAVTLPPQNALILAGAGSGKTRVLTTRIAWLITTGQVSPQGILAVTFTNKAAKEMMGRLTAQITVNPRGMWVGTFHGLCNRFLRAHHRDAALPATFQILDSADQLSSIKRLLKAANVDDEKFPPKSLQHFINGCKEEGIRASACEVSDDHNKRMIELYAAYDDQCQREGVVDFSELLLRTYELMSRNLPLQHHYRSRFRHILVDEFQDTNNLQYKWLKLLAGEGNAVFAVGDDDQSIYAFRGANIGNMAAFEREFKVQNLIRLEQNYRSNGNILNCANELIKNNSRRLGKNLWTDSGEGEPVRVFEAMTDGQEAQWLIEEVKSLVNEGYSRSDIAVLYRSNAQSRIIEHGLFNAGLPYKVYGGLRFFERAEVKHALAYLRLMENPDDETAFLRVVNFPTRGIGARSLEQLQDHARNQGISLYRSAATMPGNAAGKILQFVKLIERLRFDTQVMSLADAVEYVVETSGLIDFYQGEKEGQDRIENLRELKTAAKGFEVEQGIALDTPANFGVSNVASGLSSGERSALDSGGEPSFVESIVVDPTVVDMSSEPSFETTGQAPSFAQPITPTIEIAEVSPLASFLAHASLEAGDNQAGEGTPALQLMTVHSAKGLEFDAVFATGLEEGLFPHENSANELDGVEEERRLMYVAVTRARKRLYISFAQTRQLHGQTRYHVKSRFLEELPQGALKWLTPPMPAYGQNFGSSSFGSNSFGSNASGSSNYGNSGNTPRMGYNQVAGQSATPRSDQQLAARMSDSPWRMGQSVRHAKFGDGVVVSLEGSGTDARIQVNFGAAGVKWLALSIVKLVAI
jgi:DNA helicase II / ATP-dependent DNA helicase PcrA